MAKVAKAPAKRKKAVPATARNWSWLLGLGVLFVIFGFLGFGCRCLVGLGLAV